MTAGEAWALSLLTVMVAWILTRIESRLDRIERKLDERSQHEHP